MNSETEKLILEINKEQEVETRKVREGQQLEHFMVRESFIDGAVRVENEAMREARDYISNVNRFLDRQAINNEPEHQGWALDNECEQGR